MTTNDIFAKRMARPLAVEELDEVRGGWYQSYCMVHNTCHVSGAEDGSFEADGVVF